MRTPSPTRSDRLAAHMESGMAHSSGKYETSGGADAPGDGDANSTRVVGATGACRTGVPKEKPGLTEVDTAEPVLYGVVRPGTASEVCCRVSASRALHRGGGGGGGSAITLLRMSAVVLIPQLVG